MKKLGIIILLVLGGLAVSWGVVVGFIKLICMCFSWNFNLLIATGIWLVFCLINLLLSPRSRG